MGVALGIDSHKKSLGAGATDELGREVAAKEFPMIPRVTRRCSPGQGLRESNGSSASRARGAMERGLLAFCFKPAKT
jgi:hypothetical protein